MKKKRWEVHIAHEDIVSIAIVWAKNSDEVMKILVEEGRNIKDVIALEAIESNVIYVDFVNKVKVA